MSLIPAGVNRVRLDRGLPALRDGPRRPAARAGAPSVHRAAPRRPRLLDSATRAGPGAGTTTRCYNGNELGSGIHPDHRSRGCSGGSSSCSAFPRPRSGGDSASCSTGSRPARRRTAASRSGSTGSRCCWRARLAAGRDRVPQDHGRARAVRGRADAGGPGRPAGAAPEVTGEGTTVAMADDTTTSTASPPKAPTRCCSRG